MLAVGVQNPSARNAANMGIWIMSMTTSHLRNSVPILPSQQRFNPRVEVAEGQGNAIVILVCLAYLKEGVRPKLPKTWSG